MSSKIYRLLAGLILSFLLCLFIGDSAAQTDGDDFRSKLEKIKLEKLLNKLALDKPAEAEFTRKYKEFNSAIRELNKSRAKVVKQIENNLDNGTSLDTLIQKMMALEQEVTTKRKEFADDLRTFLTPRQIGQMFIFEKNFALEVRKILKEYRKK